MSPLIVQYALKMQSQIQGLIQEELHALEILYIYLCHFRYKQLPGHPTPPFHYLEISLPLHVPLPLALQCEK